MARTDSPPHPPSLTPVPPSVWPQVRQWPGNGADLDFRGVVQRCRAVLVAAAPVPGVVSERFMENKRDLDAYQASAEYKEHAKSLAFCRLWCIGESPRDAYSLPPLPPALSCLLAVGSALGPRTCNPSL